MHLLEDVDKDTSKQVGKFVVAGNAGFGNPAKQKNKNAAGGLPNPPVVAKGYPKFTGDLTGLTAGATNQNARVDKDAIPSGFHEDLSGLGTVLINASQGFEGASDQVCEKWLKDRRGRELSEEDIEHSQKVVTALKETIRLMAEVDQVIEVHGGWPLR